MRLANIPFRLESELVQRWHRWRGSRPTSRPFLSGDGYRALTPWRYEGEARHQLDPRTLPAGAVVFCEAWHLEEFLSNVAPHTRGGLIVVSSNGDPNFSQGSVARLPAQVEHLWVQNCEAVDSRVHPLPIGLENASRHANGIVRDFQVLRKKPEPTRNRILWGFAEVTNPVVRGAARAALERCAVADRQPAVNSRVYRTAVAHYRFVASPPGNGQDCHRTWEALYLRVVPIVIRSRMTEHFASLGLPLWLVDRYDELNGETESTLERRYASFRAGFTQPSLWMDYWEEAILHRA